VSVTVSSVAQKILLSQTGLTFTVVAGGGAPLQQSFGVLNLGSGVMMWSLKLSTLSGGQEWLKATPGSGFSTGGSFDIPLVDVSIDPGGLAPGEYDGTIQVTSGVADNSPQTISVILNVLPPGSNPGPTVRPTGLIFTGVTGNNPGSQTVLISNPGSSSISYSSGRVPSEGLFAQLPPMPLWPRTLPDASWSSPISQKSHLA
jgi:hypothetical protein